MTLKQRRDILFQMYFCAVGLAQMTEEEHRKAFLASPFDTELPGGFCNLLRYMQLMTFDLEDILERPVNRYSVIFWYPPWDWTTRAKVLLKAIEKTYE